MKLLGRMVTMLVFGLLIHASFSTNSDTVKIELNALELAHATNVARMKHLILRETGISEEPLVTPERMRELQMMFNESAEAYALYHEEEAYEGAAFMGHVQGVDNDTVSFVLGPLAANGRIESANLILYLRAAVDVRASKFHLEVKDETDSSLADATLTVPNSPSKRYTVPLNVNALQRSVEAAKTEEGAVLKLRMSARLPSGLDLLVHKGRDGFEPHMAVAIEMKFASTKLQSKRRLKRAQPSKMGMLPKQCEKGQTECCPYIQDFTWTELGINNIVAPEKFQSVVCRGHCRNFEYTDYKHTITRQAIVEHVREPCCHPIEFEAQQVVYVDQDRNAVQRSIPNFIATRCVCD